MKRIHFKQVRDRVILWLSKSYSIYVLMSAIVFIFLMIAVISRKLGISDVVELSAFSAVLLESTLVAVSRFLCKRMANKVEDPSKLTTDYEKLVKTYQLETGRMLRGADGEFIPVVIEEWLYNKNIKIIDCPGKRYVLPNQVVKYYEELFSSHQTSNIYNNINIRVSDWKTCDGEYLLMTSRTTYYDSLVTNRAMDYEFEKGLSIRQLYECGPYLQSLLSSKLSNHLGFNGFIESKDNYIAFVYRQGNVSIGKRTWGNSIGASLKTKYALDNGTFTLLGLENGILREIYDELGIEEKDISTVDGQFRKTRVIAAYRDLVEGGKPQLLIFSKSRLNMNEITRIFNNKNQKKQKST